MKVNLNNGVSMPALGYGVFRIPPKETTDAVAEALRIGYRLIDTAAVYDNEHAVGEAIRQSEMDRDDVFLGTKIWINDYGYDDALKAFEKSSRKLGVETIDLLLLHQPLYESMDKTLDAYRALEQLLADGRVRAIGVSNFMVEHLDMLIHNTEVVPAVNQIEVHPFFNQPQVRQRHQELGIVTQAWSPIGGVTGYSSKATASTFDDAIIRRIATEVGYTPAQVMLAWHLQEGRAPIPKSVTPERIAENIQALNLRLSPEQISDINALNTNHRLGPNPERVTLERMGKVISDA